MTEVFVAGVGMTSFGKFPQLSIKALTSEAVGSALGDAGASIPDVEAVFFGNVSQGVMDGQQLIRGQVAMQPLGIGNTAVINVENACATGGTALHQAYAYLRAGMGDVVLAVGAEKMYSPDRTRIAPVFEGGWDVDDVPAILNGLATIGRGVESPYAEIGEPEAPTTFMGIYACLARSHMRRFGLTVGQLAAVAEKNHRHALLNERAQYRISLTAEDILRAPVVAWPLTLPMCSPISDGAAAAVVCTRGGLNRLRTNRPLVQILASSLGSGTARGAEDLEHHVARRVASRAYETAGVGPEDMSIAEVHDASAFAEVLQTENLGFCETGQGGWCAERGETTLGGRIPVNPSGGLESKGHPIAATGLAQIYELVTQLRGEAGTRQVPGARLAIAENGGGFHKVEEAAVCVTILGR